MTTTPEPGITYLCRLDGCEPEPLTYVPANEIALGEWYSHRGTLHTGDEVEIIRPVTQRITDEGGHWEGCTADEYRRAMPTRVTHYDNHDVYERWIPDAPPVTVPTEPTYGIASGTTSGLTEFTDALCRVINAGSIRVDLPDGDTGYVFREQIDRITAWRTIPAPGSES